MSLLTRFAGLDPLIAAARRHDWNTVLSETRGLIEKYAGEEAAARFDVYLSLLKGGK